MAKFVDWHQRLTAYIADVARIPLRPGHHDCLIFADRAIEAQTGLGRMGPWIGRYASFSEGFDLARSNGCDDPFAWVLDGLEEVPPAYAQVGDIAMFDGIDGLPALAVVAGSHVYTVHVRGLRPVVLTEVKRAWRVC